MKIKEKIFQAFMVDSIEDSDSSGSDDDKFYTHEDPFDFYRVEITKKQYIPITQRGLRKAFSEGIIGIEFFIVMAASLRPLVDEAQDIDEITRLLSQQKLSLRPNLHSVNILRNMIKDPSPEIALYAAEGLNTIENSYIEKIQNTKEKISKKQGKDYVLYYLLGKLYLEFAKLLEGQNLIQKFYFNEALTSLKKANLINTSSKRILGALADVALRLGSYFIAINIFSYLFTESEGKDMESLQKMAECYYNLGDYDNIRKIADTALQSQEKLDENFELILYQWQLNI